MWLPFPEGMAIARRLMPFGVQRLLYSGRTAKAEAAEVKGEFGKKKWIQIVINYGHFSYPISDNQLPCVDILQQLPWTRFWLTATSLWFPVP